MKLQLLKKIATFSFLLFIFTLLLVPVFSVSATDYVPLAPITGTLTPGGNSTNLPTYLTGIFKVGIAVAGILAFLMIVLGGFQYLSTDAIMGKEEGRQRITRALGGLILALAAYIILYTINPNLVNLNLNFGAQTTPGQDSTAPTAPADFSTQLDQMISNVNQRLDSTRAAADDIQTTADEYQQNLNEDLINGNITKPEYDAGVAEVNAMYAQAATIRNYNDTLGVFTDSTFQGTSNAAAGDLLSGKQNIAAIMYTTANEIPLLQDAKMKDRQNAATYDAWIATLNQQSDNSMIAIAQADINNKGDQVLANAAMNALNAEKVPASNPQATTINARIDASIANIKARCAAGFNTTPLNCKDWQPPGSSGH